MALYGLEGYVVNVQVDVPAGMPNWGIVGLPDTSIKEAKERVQTAIKNSVLNYKTEERIKHIQEHHPGDYENYNQYITDTVSDPDYIIDDTKNLDTVLFMKTIKKDYKNIIKIFR